MILIADSGSTKTHWCLMAANGHCSEYFTDGINPFQQTSDAIKNSINNQLLPKMAGEMWAGKITGVYFYGAGCTPEKIPVVVYALEDIFKGAKIEVYSDMVGAACGLLAPNANCIPYNKSSSSLCSWARCSPM